MNNRQQAASTTSSNTSSSLVDNLNNYLKNVRKAKGLKEPRKYEDYNKEAKELFVSDVGEGFTVQLNKNINHSAQHEFSMGHSIFVGGNGMRAPDYNTTLSFSNKKTQFFSQIGFPHFLHYVSLRHKFFKEMLYSEITYVSANNALYIKGDFTDKDYIIDAQYDLEKGKIQVSYMQSVLPFLQLGCSGFFRTTDRVSGLGYCCRYQPSKQTVITGEAKVTGALSQINTYNLKASYFQQVAIDTYLCTEATYDISERALNFVYGFQQNFQTAKLRVTANQQFVIAASFDVAPSMATNINTTIEANPAKSEFKFGVTVNMA
ncbi:hypothetical protein NAEGRDRAFT_58963 [Naegleria gruberi]|uniref:Uncharacterized protein n=1 Tax=Naegleria gruberi TaxID=5762 RepID=D2VQW8_NAEGR|nr:uncharacterized protein NAEGRDRAFT_58963 [Naegleria gruberi]EFC40786.1 hypothetical protein NAEGRDRAFT_58963 [Naegleria gruberi]|eukprot:XP_002673530.1 hypothetical protein NAEGRDRAFT_58963 [Naegleria gruberi strain NEG-M]